MDTKRSGGLIWALVLSRRRCFADNTCIHGINLGQKYPSASSLKYQKVQLLLIASTQCLKEGSHLNVHEHVMCRILIKKKYINVKIPLTKADVGRKCRRYLCDCRIWVSTAEVTDWMRKCLTFSLELEEEHAEWVDDLRKKKIPKMRENLKLAQRLSSRHRGTVGYLWSLFFVVVCLGFFLVLWMRPNPSWQVARDIKLLYAGSDTALITKLELQKKSLHLFSFFLFYWINNKNCTLLHKNVI